MLVDDTSRISRTLKDSFTIHDELRYVLGISRSQANVHIRELIAKGYLTIGEDGHVERAEMSAETSFTPARSRWRSQGEQVMEFRLENESGDVLILRVEPGDTALKFEVRPRQPSREEIRDAQKEIRDAQIAPVESRELPAWMREKAKLVRMRPTGQPHQFLILTYNGEWTPIDVREPRDAYSVLVASGLYWYDYEAGVLEAAERDNPDLQPAI